MHLSCKQDSASSTLASGFEHYQKWFHMSYVSTPQWYFTAGSLAIGGLIVSFGTFFYLTGMVSLTKLGAALIIIVPISMLLTEMFLAHYFGVAYRAKQVSHSFAVKNNSLDKTEKEDDLP